MTLRIGLIQFAPASDLQSNYEIVTQYAETLHRSGAELIIIPECWICEYDMTSIPSHAEPIPGPSSNFLSSLAARLDVYIIAGTIPESRDGQLFNTCPIISNTGEIIGKYSKIYLFRLNIPGKLAHNEGDVFRPGADRFSFSIGSFRIGIGVCFDVRFPQLSLDYLVKDDCNVLVFPSAFTAVTGPLHWKLLGCARAIDTLSYVVMVSSSFDPDRVFKGHGSSFVSDPMGQVVDELGKEEGARIVEIAKEKVDTARSHLPVVSYQREKLYGLTPDGI
jgi:omega-amidase